MTMRVYTGGDNTPSVWVCAQGDFDQAVEAALAGHREVGILARQRFCSNLSVLVVEDEEMLGYAQARRREYSPVLWARL